MQVRYIWAVHLGQLAENEAGSLNTKYSLSDDKMLRFTLLDPQSHASYGYWVYAGWPKKWRRCGGIFSDNDITHSLLILTVKEF